jgi:hypothetical protein
LGWRIIIIGTLAAALLLFALFLFSGDPALYILFFVTPGVVLLAAVLLLLLIFRKTRTCSAELLLTTFVFVGVMIVGLRFEKTLRPAMRWAFFSQKFKREVLGQPGDGSGEFKHVEWDGWGGAPVGDWTSYVVFDPADSIAADTGHQHLGRITGIPCDVLRIQRLESHWYQVTLEVDEWWEQCGNQGKHTRNPE